VRAAVDRLPADVGLDRGLLAQMLELQGALGVTAIGGGFAIPHVRGPIVLPLGQPVLALGLLAQPVDFGAPDGRPVQALFTLVTPTIRVHLHLLARLSAALGGEFGRRVTARAADADVLAALRACEPAAARDATGPVGS
jgi:PTS system nitrogen regulatory IIA component